jgi:CRISPR-associated exonuclease Cas4
VEKIRAMLHGETLPAAVNDSRCNECSLKDVCQPEVMTAQSLRNGLLSKLFDPDA